VDVAEDEALVFLCPVAIGCVFTSTLAGACAEPESPVETLIVAVVGTAFAVVLAFSANGLDALDGRALKGVLRLKCILGGTPHIRLGLPRVGVDVARIPWHRPWGTGVIRFQAGRKST